MDTAAVFLQKACLHHRFIRSRDTSCIVERPERLRAVNVGLAAAAARLEYALVEQGKSKEAGSIDSAMTSHKCSADADELANALGKLNIAASSSSGATSTPVQFIHSNATVDLFNNAAVKFIHGDIEGDLYLENLKRWARESAEKIGKGESEIPEGLPQGDLYRMWTFVDNATDLRQNTVRSMSSLDRGHTGCARHCV